VTALDASREVSAAEIAELTAWARSLAQQGAGTDPAQRAAYLAAKAHLLTRIADQHAAEHPCRRTDARQFADEAHAVAAQTAALLPATDKETA
jgi:hypothetical protein